MKKVALVTGGARGIGRAITQNLARDYDVAITHRTTEPGTELGDVCAIRADFTDAGSHRLVVDAVIARFGRLDLLVNNAGAIAISPAHEFDMDAYRRQLDVNLLAPHGLLAAALPHLTSGAVIINISSINAVLPPMGASIYGASKAALDLWTRAMAKELGPRGIRVNGVAPGAVNTPEEPRDADLTALFVEMTALGRLASADDIADAVRFLASDSAASITGEVLKVSGGYRL